MAPCSVTAAPSPSLPHSPDSAPDITPPPPSSETRNKVDRVPPARNCHKLRLASAHSPSKSVFGFLAFAEPTASAFCPARRFRVGRPDTLANPVLCSSPPLSSCRVYPESPKIKTPISAGGLTVSRSEPIVVTRPLRSNFDFFRFGSHLKMFEPGRKTSVIDAMLPVADYLGDKVPDYAREGRGFAL